MRKDGSMITKEQFQEFLTDYTDKIDNDTLTLDDIYAIGLKYKLLPRTEKNWAIADKVRTLFDSISIVLKDTKEATATTTTATAVITKPISLFFIKYLRKIKK